MQNFIFTATVFALFLLWLVHTPYHITQHEFNFTLLCTFPNDLQCEVFFLVFYMKTEIGSVMNCLIKEDCRKHKLFQRLLIVSIYINLDFLIHSYHISLYSWNASLHKSLYLPELNTHQTMNFSKL
jgi:hypothetical protein